MGSDSYPVKLTASATTTLGSVFLTAICVNKTLVGSLTVNDGVANKAIFAATTPVGSYHTLPNGGRYANLAANLSGADDVTVYVRVIN